MQVRRGAAPSSKPLSASARTRMSVGTEPAREENWSAHELVGRSPQGSTSPGVGRWSPPPLRCTDTQAANRMQSRGHIWTGCMAGWLACGQDFNSGSCPGLGPAPPLVRELCTTARRSCSASFSKPSACTCVSSLQLYSSHSAICAAAGPEAQDLGAAGSQDSAVGTAQKAAVHRS